MRYYAQYNDSGNLIAIGTGAGGTEITEAEYNRILAEPQRGRPEHVPDQDRGGRADRSGTGNSY